MTSDQSPQPSYVPAPAQSTGASNRLIAGLGCSALIALIALVLIVVAMVNDGDDDDAAAGQLSAESRTATGSSDPTAAPTVQTTHTTGPSVSTPQQPRVTAADTPTAFGGGSSRSSPVPFGEAGVAGDWEVQILDVVRGDEAFDRLIGANQFNEPAPPGMEYVLVHARVEYIGAETEPQIVDFTWFHGTGDARVKWAWPSVVKPAPELDAELQRGDAVSGWTVVLARAGEGNLIAIFEPFLSTDDGDEVFLALEDGASVPPLPERLAEEDALGLDPTNPVPAGDRIVGETWEIRVIESVRGDEALRRVKEANQFNDDPEPGMEYVLVRIGARNVGLDDDSDNIDKFSFAMTGEAGQVYELPSIVDPEPALDYDVYPGGEVDGWVTLQVAAGEQNLRLVYEPAFSFTAEPRYLAIQ